MPEEIVEPAGEVEETPIEAVPESPTEEVAA